MAVDGSTLTITFTTDESGAQTVSRISQVANSTALDAAIQRTNAIINLMARAISGGGPARMYTTVDTVTGVGSGRVGSCNVTVATLPTAGQTIFIGNITITFQASAGNENECTLGGTTTVCATNLAAVINAHTVLRGWFSATSSTNVVTVTSLMPGNWQRFASMITGTAGANVTFSQSSLVPASETQVNAERGTSWNLGRPPT